MYTYLCKLLYIADTSNHSANSPDQVGHLCLIKSDSKDLENYPTYKFRKYYAIEELLEQHDCEEIKIELLQEDDLPEYSEIKDILFIDTKDLD